MTGSAFRDEAGSRMDAHNRKIVITWKILLKLDTECGYV
jgi:hypothetical protein